MKTSVTGFPRVGKLRELKFATEKYFRKEISADELRETAKNIRISQWLLQQKNNIDYIPSNDFSFYDGTLDTAVLFNIIPKKYADHLKLFGLKWNDASPISTKCPQPLYFHRFMMSIRFIWYFISRSVFG